VQCDRDRLRTRAAQAAMISAIGSGEGPAPSDTRLVHIDAQGLVRAVVDRAVQRGRDRRKTGYGCARLTERKQSSKRALRPARMGKARAIGRRSSDTIGGPARGPVRRPLALDPLEQRLAHCSGLLERRSVTALRHDHEARMGDRGGHFLSLLRWREWIAIADEHQSWH